MTYSLTLPHSNRDSTVPESLTSWLCILCMRIPLQKDSITELFALKHGQKISNMISHAPCFSA